uniref:Uncharacterized protein n=1 Tax=Setaria italica TaxID=4555 RepID=K3YE99_SETIT
SHDPGEPWRAPLEEVPFFAAHHQRPRLRLRRRIRPDHLRRRRRSGLDDFLGPGRGAARRQEVPILPAPAPDQHGGALRQPRFLVFLHVLLAPCCPWRAADQPMAMISYISWISLLFCLYLFFLITSLSPATKCAALIFLRVSYLVVVGWVAAYYVSPFTGMILLYLNTFPAAGFFGYALAEHHLRNAPAFRSLKSKPKATPNKATSVHAAEADPKVKTTQHPAFYMHLLSIACGVRVLWVCCALSPRIAVLEASVAVGFCLFSWTCYLHYWPLNQMYFDVEGLGKLTCCAVMSFALYAAMGGQLFGEVFGVWFTVAGITGYHGYSLAMCHCYKQLLRRPR